jgi:L,D-transpeptidase YcbB
MLKQKLISIIFCCQFCFITHAQFSSISLKLFINEGLLLPQSLVHPNEVKEFYLSNNYNICWVGKSNNLDQLLEHIQQSQSLGLNKQDYQSDLLGNSDRPLILNSEKDSIFAEVKYTDAAIHFFYDVARGNKVEPLGYNGLNYSPSCYNIPLLLNNALSTGQFSLLLSSIEPADTAYVSIKRKLLLFNELLNANNFIDAIITSSKISNRNKLLITRLSQLGFTTVDTSNIEIPDLINAVKLAQRQFGLFEDGILSGSTLRALNVPLVQRAGELCSTLNTIRWLQCMKVTNHIIIVNIPSATLLLYQHEKVVLESRIIVGKKSTPTPTLSSSVTDVILYPYWNVPYKIATREILPKVKKNRNYLEVGNFQVLNKEGVVIKPENINWHLLNANYFPYSFRQSTGCDNSLGIIKFNFYNPYSVYLHDTPDKSLFNRNKRYFSHGCMRIEKVVELAKYVTYNNNIAIDTIIEKKCIKNQPPIVVPVTEVIPVFVLYHTAWFNAAGSINFYEDVYNKNTAVK